MPGAGRAYPVPPALTGRKTGQAAFQQQGLAELPPPCALTDQPGHIGNFGARSRMVNIEDDICCF